MAWIEVVPAEDAQDELREVYEKVKISEGPIFTPYEVMTLNGPGLKALEDFQRVLRFGDSPLTRLQRELIATQVSVLNKCTF